MSYKPIKFIFLFLSISFVSCASISKSIGNITGSTTKSNIKFKEEEFGKDESIIYFGRNAAPARAGSRFNISVNDSEIGKLRMGAYFYKKMKPGIHDLQFECGGGELTHKIVLKPNRPYYFIIEGVDYYKAFYKKGNPPEELKKLKLDFGK